MFPKISFRYGYNVFERCALLLWTTAWAVGLFVVLREGAVNSAQRGGAVRYTRADDPVSYWIIVAMAIAACILGLALTFELSFKNDPESVTHKNRE